ncbi:hypothetical protein DEO72_LG10g2445 [Vigna unguiculata]|uniref:Uncharacterized protein n=1 Tax=Vigna unguiculata TaxID=3917 RepID=A0A4D6NEA5_VIGUN|nr:hypothetical protein DEO72_LG10g2445 [Vigna unguiculata]
MKRETHDDDDGHPQATTINEPVVKLTKRRRSPTIVMITHDKHNVVIPSLRNSFSISSFFFAT